MYFFFEDFKTCIVLLQKEKPCCWKICRGSLPGRHPSNENLMYISLSSV